MIKIKILEKLNIRNEVNNYILINIYNTFNLINYNLYLGTIHINKYYFTLIVSDCEINNEFIISNNIKQININNNIYTNNFINVFEKINKMSYIKNNSIKIFIDDNINKQFIMFPIPVNIIDWIKADIKIFKETFNDYENISLPYINSILHKNTKWINNILYNNYEKNVILFKNEYFIICKDINWKHNNNNFYIIVIPFKPIKSIRDLSSNDIELLLNIKNKVIELALNYNLYHDQLYMFFHYHPSYYQLHLHVCIMDHYALDTKYHKLYQLDEIINKLKIDSDYWKKSVLTFELLSTNKLYYLLEQYQT